jgi:hypothetical protein
MDGQAAVAGHFLELILQIRRREGAGNGHGCPTN